MAAVVSSSGGAGGGTGGARGIGAVVAAKHIGIKTLPRESTTPGLDSGFTSDASVKVNGTPKKAGAKEGGAGGLDKLSTMNLLDGAIAQAKVGMENGRAEPLDKGEFVRSVLALVYVSCLSLFSSEISKLTSRDAWVDDGILGVALCIIFGTYCSKVTSVIHSSSTKLGRDSSKLKRDLNFPLVFAQISVERGWRAGWQKRRRSRWRELSQRSWECSRPLPSRKAIVDWTSSFLS